MIWEFLAFLLGRFFKILDQNFLTKSALTLPQFLLHAVSIFQYYKHVQQHIMYKHEKKKPWKCDQCEYAHALQTGLQEHVRNCHPKESDLKVCHICGYKTTLNHNLKEHIERTHEKKRRFTCNLW